MMAMDYVIVELIDGSAVDVFELANTLIAASLQAVHDNGGVVLHFQADRVVCTWNTHSVSVRPALNACTTALLMKACMESVPEESRVTWSAVIVGGWVYAGVTGTARQKAPFILSSLTALLYQLPSLARLIEAPVIITSFIQRATAHELNARPVDLVRLPSSFQDEIIYELLSAADPENDHHTAELWRDAFCSVVNARLPEAIDKLRLYEANLTASDAQVDRMMHLVAMLQKGTDSEGRAIPEPYVREYEGWRSWSASTTGSDVATLPATSSKLAVRVGSPPVGFVWPSALKVTNAPEDDLRSALTELPSSPVVETCSWSSSSCNSHESNLPNTFVDMVGSAWIRGTQRLGAGASGDVWLGMSTEGSLVAMKWVPLPAGSPSKSLSSRGADAAAKTAAIVSEVEILSKHRHDAIVHLVSCAVLLPSHVVIIMEYVSGGSIASILKQFGRVPCTTAKRYTKDILSGLSYLHSRGITHADLKPGNVLLHADGRCKLADFGTSRSGHNKSFRPVGTPLYMAPEACSGCCEFASDFWSLGLTVAEMLSGCLPFSWDPSVHESPVQRMRWLCKLFRDVDDLMPIPLPLKHVIDDDSARDFIASVVVKVASDRLSGRQLSLHPFVAR
ncbi:Protein kinase byr2 [Diplonema papillatum]|nr:Protein kinase byr2 [Diplonema papillatum]